MLFKCDHCPYVAKKRRDMVRHQSRKTPCYKEKKVDPCNYIGDENVNAGDENVNVGDENVDDDQENAIVPQSNFQCLKCKCFFKRNQSLEYHKARCNGLDPLQCVICLKMFVTRQGKAQHKRYVKCVPPPPPPSTVNNNITNNNTNNINNGINANTVNINVVRGDFDKMSNEDIKRIIDSLGKAEYTKAITENVKSGKYLIPRTMDMIFFNDNFPELQILKKERRNDNMVEVYVKGKWEKRLTPDVQDDIVRSVERYHNQYVKDTGEKCENMMEGSQEWKRATTAVRRYGNTMVWYKGFVGNEIERIGVELNFPERVAEKKAKGKELGKIINEKIYHNTQMLEAIKRAIIEGETKDNINSRDGYQEIMERIVLT